MAVVITRNNTNRKLNKLQAATLLHAVTRKEMLGKTSRAETQRLAVSCAIKDKGNTRTNVHRKAS